MRIAFLFCNHVCKSDFIIFANKTLYFPSFCVSELSFPAILTLHVFLFYEKVSYMLYRFRFYMCREVLVYLLPLYDIYRGLKAHILSLADSHPAGPTRQPWPHAPHPSPLQTPWGTLTSG